MKKRIGMILCVIVLLGLLSVPGTASGKTKNQGQELFNSFIQGQSAPGLYNADVDPYGQEAGQAFSLDQMSELLVYATNSLYNGGTRSFQSYNGMNLSTAENSQIISGQSANKTYAISNDYARLNNVKTVAFDPTGSGSRDCVAVLGMQRWNKNDIGLQLYVYDKKGTGHYIQTAYVNWIEDDYWYANAGNYYAITAGDYDGDGRDSLIIAAQMDRVNSTDAKQRIIEIKLSGSNGILPDNPVESTRDLVYSQEGVSVNKLRLYFQADTGDVNGDGTDDLVLLNYDETTARATVFVGFGSKTNSIERWADVQASFGSIIAPGMAAGDINGDGADEIIVSGIQATLDPNDPYQEKYKDADESKQNVYVYSAVGCSGSWTSGHFFSGSMTQLLSTTINSNAWTQDVFYPSDDQYPSMALACAHVNGKDRKELIFINGTVYEYTAAKALTEVYTPSFFTDKDDEINLNGSKYETSNEWISCVVSGNFNHNKDGVEQFAYVIAFKRKSYEDYYFSAGFVGKTAPGTDMICTDGSTHENRFYPGNALPSQSTSDPGAGFTSNKCLNYVLCPVDNDDDSVVLRYNNKKSYLYSDPSVLAVLQAAPFYEEVAEGVDNSTSYSITETRNYETGSSDSTSFGAGLTMSLGGTVGGIDAKLGYSTEWSSEFTKALETSTEYGWTAADEDMVVLYATPVVNYVYDMYDRSAESWVTDGFSVSVADDSAYRVITVEEYNAFARYYNTTVMKRNCQKKTDLASAVPSGADYNAYVDNYNTAAESWNKQGKKAVNERLIKLLYLVEDEYLGNEGDPWAYLANLASAKKAELLQKSPQSVTVGSGSTSFSWSQEHSSSESTAVSHGFSFELSASFGFESSFVESTWGFYGSLDYMHGSSSTVTEASGVGISCELSNIGYRAAGISKTEAEQYTLQYRMVKWDSPLIGERVEEGQKKPYNIPIYGYLVSGLKTRTLSAPTVSVKADAASGQPVISWTKVPNATAYHVYCSTTGKRVYEGSDLSYTDTGRTVGKTYKYKVRAITDAKGYESANGPYSSLVSVRILPAQVSGLKASAASPSSVKLSWSRVSGASGYKIYRAASKDGSYSLIKTVSSGDTLSYTNTGRTAGIRYYYKVAAYVSADGSTLTGAKSSYASAMPKPAALTGLTAASASATSVKLSWTKSEGAAGYEILRATSKTGTYKLVKTVTSGDTLSYTNKSLTSGKTYYYKVQAFTEAGGEKVYGSESSVVSAKPVPAKVTGLKASAVSATSIKLSWTKVTGASGYKVYRATSKTGTYKLVKTVTSGDTLSYTNKSLTAGKTYYYKVLAYRTVSDTKVAGPYSATVSCKAAK